MGIQYGKSAEMTVSHYIVDDNQSCGSVSQRLLTFTDGIIYEKS